MIPEKQSVLPEQRWPQPLPDGARRPLKVLLAALGPEAQLHYAADDLIAAKAQAPDENFFTSFRLQRQNRREN